MIKFRLKPLKSSQSGFTLLELLIATTVFSVILLLCVFGLVQIGNTYYKGVNSVKTQAATRDAIDSISQSIQYGGEVPNDQVLTSDVSGTFCVGNIHYSYMKRSRVKASVAGSYALVRSRNCSAPTDGRELLGENMQLIRFSMIERSGGYRIDLKVTTSPEDDYFDATTGNCNGGPGGQFCASSELTTTVQRKLR